MAPVDFVRLMLASKILAESGDRQTARELADRACDLILRGKGKYSDWHVFDLGDVLKRAQFWLGETDDDSAKPRDAERVHERPSQVLFTPESSW